MKNGANLIGGFCDLTGPTFAQKCLDKDPAKRWSCEQLLQHPFFERHSFKKPDYGELERIGRVRLLTHIQG